MSVNATRVQRCWLAWRKAQPWDDAPIYLAAKIAEEVGEVLGAVLKMEQNGRSGTHPDHDLAHLRVEIGQLVGTVLCVCEHYDIDPLAEAEAELRRVHERFPIPEAPR